MFEAKHNKSQHVPATEAVHELSDPWLKAMSLLLHTRLVSYFEREMTLGNSSHPQTPGGLEAFVQNQRLLIWNLLSLEKEIWRILYLLAKPINYNSLFADAALPIRH